MADPKASLSSSTAEEARRASKPGHVRSYDRSRNDRRRRQERPYDRQDVRDSAWPRPSDSAVFNRLSSSNVHRETNQPHPVMFPHPHLQEMMMIFQEQQRQQQNYLTWCEGNPPLQLNPFQPMPSLAASLFHTFPPFWSAPPVLPPSLQPPPIPSPLSVLSSSVKETKQKVIPAILFDPSTASLLEATAKDLASLLAPSRCVGHKEKETKKDGQISVSDVSSTNKSDEYDPEVPSLVSNEIITKQSPDKVDTVHQVTSAA